MLCPCKKFVKDLLPAPKEYALELQLDQELERVKLWWFHSWCMVTTKAWKILTQNTRARSYHRLAACHSVHSIFPCKIFNWSDGDGWHELDEYIWILSLHLAVLVPRTTRGSSHPCLIWFRMWTLSYASGNGTGLIQLLFVQIFSDSDFQATLMLARKAHFQLTFEGGSQNAKSWKV